MPNVTRVNYGCFETCTGLTSLTLPSVNDVESYAMPNCTNLVRVDFPKLNATNFGMCSSCKSLTALILRRTDRPTALAEADYVFLNTPIANGTGYVYVPAALVDQYKAATNWVKFADQIRAIEDYPEICDPE